MKDQKPLTFEEYSKQRMEEIYQDYLAEIVKENECLRKTGHINQKWSGVAGCYVCLDCGAWYV